MRKSLLTILWASFLGCSFVRPILFNEVNKSIKSFLGIGAIRFWEIIILGIDYLNLIDISLSNYLLGFRDRDREHMLKNKVYLELLR